MSLLLKLSTSRKRTNRGGQKPRRSAQVAQSPSRFGGAPDINHGSDGHSLHGRQTPAQVVEPPVRFAPLTQESIADTVKGSLRSPTKPVRGDDGAEGLNASVPDRPAEALLQSLVARVDGNDGGDEETDRQESRVHGLSREAAMVLQGEALLSCHAGQSTPRREACQVLAAEASA